MNTCRSDCVHRSKGSPERSDPSRAGEKTLRLQLQQPTCASFWRPNPKTGNAALGCFGHSENNFCIVSRRGAFAVATAAKRFTRSPKYLYSFCKRLPPAIEDSPTHLNYHRPCVPTMRLVLGIHSNIPKAINVARVTSLANLCYLLFPPLARRG